MARRSGLGKGLQALIPTEVAVEHGSMLQELPIGTLRPNPRQPRDHFDEEALGSLAASIKELGVLQPVLVRPVGDEFEIVAGERRWRAARRAGLQTIPALVRETTDDASLEQALVENLHRADLNALEEAAAYQQLIEDFGLTHVDLAARMGKSRAAISNTLRLFQLPAGIQRLVAENQLSAGHARALLGTPDRAFQEALAKRAVTEGWSVRAVEEAVRARGGEVSEGGETPPAAKAKRLRAPGLLELEDLLAGFLDTRVQVTMGPKRGKVVIEFGDLEDLERIYRTMTASASPEP